MNIKTSRGSRPGRFAGLLLATLLPIAASAAPTVFYASPGGTGTCASSASACSLSTAKTAAETAASGVMTGNVIVYLETGTYTLTSPLNFTSADSGNHGYDVIFRADTGATPVISGGVTIAPLAWSQTGAGSWIFSTTLPPTSSFRQIFTGTSAATVKRATRARTPNAGYLTATAASSPVPSFTISTTDAAALNAQPNLGEIETVWLSNWRQKRTRIASVTPSGSTTALGFTSPENSDTVMPMPVENMGGVTGATPYYFENAKSMLDSPGEWYLDRSTHTLYYWPRAGEFSGSMPSPTPTFTTIVPGQGMDNLFYVSGATHLQFRGLTFAYSSWTAPDTYGYLDAQAALQLHSHAWETIPGAVRIDASSYVRVEGCTFQSTGANGLLFYGASDHNQAVANHLTDLGAGGIYDFSNITEASPTTATSNGNYDLISGNLVENGGKDYADAVGIMATVPNNISIEFNEVRQMPYTGINLGWNWGIDDLGANGNAVHHNYVHDVMQLLDDGGGIYSLGYMSGAQIHDNYIASITRSGTTGGSPIAGIYLDNGSELKTVTNNVVAGGVDAFYSHNSPNVSNVFEYNFYDAAIGSILDPQDPDAGGSGGNTVTRNTQMPVGGWSNTTRANIVLAAGVGPGAVGGVMTNAALGKTASATSSATGTAAANAIDDSTDEPGWISNVSIDPTPHWKIDLGSLKPIKKIEIVSRLGTTDVPQTRANFEVWASAVSTINTTHTVLTSVGAGGYAFGSTWSYVVTDPTAYRYLSIVKTALKEDLGINEIRIYR